MANEGTFVLGIDGGTESIRVGLFDLQGKLILAKQRSYETSFPQSGWAEQDPEDWWEALQGAMSDLLNESNVPRGAIKGIGLDATCCTVVFLDKHMNPLRKALLWMDVRAGREAQFIAESGHPSLKYNGYGNVSAEWMPCKALWVKRHEPEVYSKADVVCEYLDYMNYRLTGRKTASINNATIRWYYDDEEGGFPVSFYESVELGELLSKFPAEVIDMGQPISRLTRNAASQLGLEEGTMVAQGGADAFVGMVGLNAMEPGRLAFITGSSHLHLGMTKTAFHRKGIFGTYPSAVVRGLHTVEGGQISTGSIVQWFKTHFLGYQEREAESLGRGVYELMNDKARDVPIGSEGLILLDSFQGNRTPLVDPNLRGALWGLSLRHRPEHIFRAILEGIAYGTEFIFRQFKDAGYEAEEIYACGGPTKSQLWMQIHSDVSGIPIHIPEVQDAPLLGSAILGGVASGIFPTVTEAAREMVRIRDRIEPNTSNHEAYHFYLDQYIETYSQMSGLMHKMVEATRSVG